MGKGRAPEGAGRLLGGSAALSASAIISKLIGMIYKIPLVKYVGLEGMAYFLAANHIYIFLFVISTSGLPVAVSILVAEAAAGRERAVKLGRAGEAGGADGGEAVFRAALRIFLIIGGAGMALMLAAATPLADMIAIGGAARSIAAISPAVLMACVSGAYRGYFQGRGIMRHTAISQIIEAAGKLGLGLAGALFALGRGYESESVAACAIAGITAGVALATLYLAVSKRLYDARRGVRRGSGQVTRGILSRLLRIALPITVSSAMLGLGGLIDTSLIANCLGAAGFSASMANKLYSSYGNIALPLFSLPPALIAPIAMATVPLISGAFKSGDESEVRRVGGAALRLTLLAAIPAAAGLSVFSRQIVSLVFPHEIEGCAIAAPLLSLLALTIVPTCLISTTNALLQACGRADVTIISMLAGSGAKLLLEFLLVRLPGVNIAGAPISSFACALVALCFNIYFLAKYLPGLRIGGRVSAATAFSSLAAVGGAVAVWHLGGGISHHIIRISLAMGSAVLLYVMFAYLTGAINSEILAMLPGGGGGAFRARIKTTKI